MGFLLILGRLGRCGLPVCFIVVRNVVSSIVSINHCDVLLHYLTCFFVDHEVLVHRMSVSFLLTIFPGSDEFRILECTN
jgi:hypothetical protein